MRRSPIGLIAFTLAALAATPAVAGKTLELLFVGDVSFAGRPPPRGTLRPEDNPFKHVAPRFARADLVVANGEGVLTNQPPAAYGEARLNIGASPRWAPAFRAAGVGLVGLANNHSWDGGRDGVLENRRHLAASGVAVYGAGATPEEATAPYHLRDPAHPTACGAVIVPATLKSNRAPRKGAAVAYYAGERGLARLVQAVRALDRDPTCFVIVSVHWGREGVHRAPGSVVRAGRALIDAGADLIVGHHPHVLQGVEHYRGRPIVYSLGNFVFTNRTADKRETGMLSVRLAFGPAPRLQELALVPAVIGLPGFFPRPARPSEQARTAAHLREGSAALGTRVTPHADRIVFVPLAPSPEPRRPPGAPAVPGRAPAATPRPSAPRGP